MALPRITAKAGKAQYLLDPTVLRELIEYDASTGLMRWKPRSAEWFKQTTKAPEAQANNWNSANLGNNAFHEATRGGYLAGAVMRRRYLAHRVAFAIHHGRWPEGQIDHIDGDGRNNRIDNLREVSDWENKRNLARRATNSSGVTGVAWNANAKKWQAAICVRGKTQYLGTFSEMEAAVAARKAAETEYGFHPNHGRRA